MRNVDGIDLDACRDVTVSDCRIDTEDDCLVLRAIQDLYDAPAVCENVTVTNLVIQSAHNGILFENPHRYLPAGHSGSAYITNIQFSNMVIDCHEAPIKVLVEEGIALPRLANLSFADFRIRSGGPCLVQGSPETIIRDVRFGHIQIETSGKDAIRCRYCQNVHLTDVELSNRAGG